VLVFSKRILSTDFQVALRTDCCSSSVSLSLAKSGPPPLELGFEMGLDEQHGIRFLLQSSLGKVSLCRADYSDVCGFAARIQDTKMLRIGSIHIYIE
jgi:hypothetical protein